MADDTTSTPTPVTIKEKEPEIWGIPMSTLYGIGIVAVGTVSLITAIKVLLPPNFQLFPQQQQQNQQQQYQQPNLFGWTQPQVQQQQQQGNGNARPQIDNSVEEYEVYDESPYSRGLGPQNVDIEVGEQAQGQQPVYDEDTNEEKPNGDGININTDLIKADDRAFRTNESVIKNNSGIQIVESPDVVNSRRRFMRATYTTPDDISNQDYE